MNDLNNETLEGWVADAETRWKASPPPIVPRVDFIVRHVAGKMIQWAMDGQTNLCCDLAMADRRCGCEAQRIRYAAIALQASEEEK